MRKALLLALAATVGWSLAVTPLMAHDSFAARFAGTKPIDPTSSVTNDGTVANWGLETGPRDPLKPGDVIIVHGFFAKNGSHTLAGRQVQTTDGRRMFAGSPDSGPKQ
jgi:hypothetical protein